MSRQELSPVGVTADARRERAPTQDVSGWTADREPGGVALPFTEITRRLREAALPEVDVVFGIATGGVVPAALAAYRLGVELRLLEINFRAPDNAPHRAAPELLAPAPEVRAGTRVLLVDDVSVTGKTLRLAESALPGCHVTTLVLKGKGSDIVLFPEVGTCVDWPWRPSSTPPRTPRPHRQAT